MIELGKYAGAVLSAWGISLGLLAGLTAQTLLAASSARKRLEQVEERRRG
ncbi:heme exporter protein CcmD [Paracoccus sp. Z118]|nr:heme exporter protein CcmD [Paracoccus sp. Z118]MBV0893164.1 heme exporter protein CcmD [Paracoccus sp. Z118]